MEEEDTAQELAMSRGRTMESSTEPQEEAAAAGESFLCACL